jgi:hypothetical protein
MKILGFSLAAVGIIDILKAIILDVFGGCGWIFNKSFILW